MWENIISLFGLALYMGLTFLVNPANRLFNLTPALFIKIVKLHRLIYFLNLSFNLWYVNSLLLVTIVEITYIWLDGCNLIRWFILDWRLKSFPPLNNSIIAVQQPCPFSTHIWCFTWASLWHELYHFNLLLPLFKNFLLSTLLLQV